VPEITYASAAILGIIEGATEYLPVSSTFHLIWASKFLGIGQTDFQKAFEVIIQSGAILAVVLLYLPVWRKKVQLFTKIAYSFIPTAVIGLLLYKEIKNIFFENFMLQLIVFVLAGIIFIFFEQIYKPKLSKQSSQITTKEAVLIGIFQALAVVPGVSRAGAVILGMMYLKVKRDEAAEYSFLLAVPTLMAASALDLFKSAPYLLHNSSQIGILAVGFITALISALVAVKWFIGYLKNHTLTTFGVYRIVLALVLIAIFSSTI